MRYLTHLQMVLGGVCVGLVCVLAYDWILPPALASVPAAPIRSRTGLPPLPLANPSPPLETFDAINARPLFKFDRKPIPPPPSTTNAERAPPPPTVNLIGVIIDGPRQLALLRVPQSPLAVSASVGDEVQGWHVTAVYPDHVVLSLNATEITVNLNANRASDTAAVSAPATEPPQPAAPVTRSNEQKP